MFKTGMNKAVTNWPCEHSSFGPCDFGHLVLFRISDFDIRILNSLSLTISASPFSGAFIISPVLLVVLI